MNTIAVRRAAVAIAAAALLVGCGSDREYAGYQREPMPSVAGIELPELTTGTNMDLTASDGHVRVVYFGYTRCPDFCPTTMAELRLALDQIDHPELVETAMVTIDPERDIDVLDDYVRSFVPDGLAYGTDDAALLARVAAPFGAAYSVEPNPDAATDPDADPFLVSHSTSLYAVDDDGNVVLTWQYGLPVEELAADLEQLIDEETG